MRETTLPAWLGPLMICTGAVLFCISLVLTILAQIGGLSLGVGEATSTPNVLDTRIARALETVSAAETPMAELHETAQALATECAVATPVPTATSAFTLCTSCKIRADCPSGLVCLYCPTLGNICVRTSSPNADCLSCRSAMLGAQGSDADILDLDTQALWRELMSAPRQPVFTVYRNCSGAQLWVVTVMTVPRNQLRPVLIWREGSSLDSVFDAVLTELKGK